MKVLVLSLPWYQFVTAITVAHSWYITRGLCAHFGFPSKEGKIVVEKKETKYTVSYVALLLNTAAALPT